jgi:hypothetical protein
VSRELTINLPGAQSAQVVETDGDKTTVRAPIPSPPGSVVRGKVDGVNCEFELKVRNCKKDGDSFLIDGRMRNATREMKVCLKAFSAE